MSERSDMYISVRGECRGQKRLVPEEVNPLLREYRKKLEQFKIEERKSDGGMFKVWADNTDEYNGELSSDGKTLLFSHKLKIEVYDSPPHNHNNYQHSIQVKIAEGLQKIRLENGIHSQKITIVTTGIKFAGGERSSGRWPIERLAGIGI